MFRRRRDLLFQFRLQNLCCIDRYGFVLLADMALQRGDDSERRQLGH